MNAAESPEKQIEDVVASKRNSFSRNLLLSYKDEVLELLRSNDTVAQLEFLRKISFTYYGQDVSESLAFILWIYKNLTVHAIDEKEAPVPFAVLEDTYKDTVFVLQYLKEKNSLSLYLEEVKQSFFEEPNGTLSTYDGDLQQKFLKVFQSSWNYTKHDISIIYSANYTDASYLDFGFLKSAMSLRKTNGIQDLLEVGWRLFNDSKRKGMHVSESAGLLPPYIPACRIIFNVGHPELSTITMTAPGVMLTLQGKSKIVQKEFVSKIELAIKIFEICNADRLDVFKTR